MEKIENLNSSPTNFWHGQYVMFGSIVFFQIVNIVVQKIGKPKSVREDSWRWTNLVVSWVHAMIISIWDIVCFILYPELMNDLLYYKNNFIYFMVAATTGYFVYDFIDMIINNKIFKLWEITLHHIAVISMFGLNVYEGSYLAFTCVALLAELNSFFLHSRKLLQMMQFQYDIDFRKTICLFLSILFLKLNNAKEAYSSE
ncbi:hypothetical protein LOTGIDRAFT_172917 [Lottia gigantea]|uniref:TLC domain-containing protein n=1 Tax=Lottia gigantea TaxID=225164 RepID=V4B4T9_LOTGI|nr:hypothetical protein LOTGIDRAFT_172917 [Lottia gigantea]ESP00987.1 hypothetical protein LOTGIDRAFT_172917 [Lottia gigantea]